jgi:hypothetical protein
VDPPQVSTSPILFPDRAEVDAIREVVMGHDNLTMPPFRSTPLVDLNDSEPLLSFAFATLFPFEESELVKPHITAMKNGDYVRHLQGQKKPVCTTSTILLYNIRVSRRLYQGVGTASIRGICQDAWFTKGDY